MERLLAASWPAPNRDAIVNSLRAHRVSGKDARAICVRLFAKAMRAFAAESALSLEQADALQCLQEALGLIQRDLGDAYFQVAESLYSTQISEALDAEDLTGDERERLVALTESLRMSPERRGVLHREQAEVVLQRILGTGASHRSLTPREQDAITEMASRLGEQLDGGSATLAHLDRFSLLWQIENGELPKATVRTRLQLGEVCHYYTPARWFDAPSDSLLRRSSAGASIVKGLSYRAGRHRAGPAPTEAAGRLGEGTIYVTNRRILLEGAQSSSTIRYGDVSAIEPFSNGFGVERDGGMAAVILVEGDAEIATSITAEALARA